MRVLILVAWFAGGLIGMNLGGWGVGAVFGFGLFYRDVKGTDFKKFEVRLRFMI